MKLLVPTETKDLTGQQQLKDILRTQEIEKVAKEARLNLANSQAEFNASLARNRQIWAGEEESHQQAVKERQDEITALEAQKSLALMPVIEREREAEAKLKEALEFQVQLKGEQDLIELTAEGLQDKLDKVGQVEQDLIRRLKQLEIREAGVQSQKQSIINQAASLSQEMTAFLMSKGEWERELKSRQESLEKAQKPLKVLEDKLAAKQIEQDKQLNQIQLASKQLDDKRKQDMTPVRVLEQEVLELKEKAQKQLQEAQVISLKAQNDYDTKLSSLTAKADLLNVEQAKLNALQTKLNNHQSEMTEQAEELENNLSKFDFAKQQLAEDKIEFSVSQTKGLEFLDKEKQKLDRQAEDNIAILKTAQELKADADNQLQEVVGQRRDMAIQASLLGQSKQQAQTVILASVKQKNEAETAIEELTKQQQEFLEWRNGIEKALEDSELQNGAKSKLLQVKEKKLNAQERFLAEWSVKLKDERGVLDRAFKEYNILMEKQGFKA